MAHLELLGAIDGSTGDKADDSVILHDWVALVSRATHLPSRVGNRIRWREHLDTE
jgi:hypothetical protein